jgi:ubiquinone/menaquinone biosynthesis C-methylase UbiE
MALPTPVTPDPNWPAEAVAATKRYLSVVKSLTDRTFWPVIMFSSTNLFLWHLDAFAKESDPVPEFVEVFDKAAKLLELARDGGVCGNYFPGTTGPFSDDQTFEDHVSGLFSDVWLDMTDDIYFDQSYEFTKERFEKSGVDPFEIFKGKVVVDAGCGSGKFSAALARFGAAKVIGVDIGERGLDFARTQASKVHYGDRLEYRYGSLLEMPFQDGSVDMVWSNGVIHHTLAYETCLSEFHRITKSGGSLFLYVNGRMGLLELLMDTLRLSTEVVPRSLFQHFLRLQGINSGRLYWMMDFLFAPYEWKSEEGVRYLLLKHGYNNIRQLLRGVASDQIEQISAGLPFAKVKYGDGQLKFIADRA